MFSRASTMSRKRRSSGAIAHELESLESRQLLATYAVADYMPLHAGDQWSYAGLLNGAPATAVATLSAGGTISGFNSSKLTTVLSPNSGGPSTTDAAYFAHTSTGLRVLRHDLQEPSLSSSVLFGAGARLATVNLTDGVTVHILKSLSGSSSDGRAWSGQFVGDLNVVGIENITVGAGSFEALRITLSGTLDQNGTTGWSATEHVTETRWLVRGVGAVRVDFASATDYSDQPDHSFRYNMGLTSASMLTGVTDFLVRGKGVDISYGDTSPSASDGTNYAGIDVETQTKTRVFVIRNTSDHAITLAPGNQGFITLTGTNVDDFVVVRQPAMTLQPGQSTPFSVRFDPSALGFRFATVSFATTQTGAQPFTFDIRGTGILVGRIEVYGPQAQRLANGAPASIGNGTVFGSVNTDGNARIQRLFTLGNNGPGNLVLTANSRVVISGLNAEDFTVTVLPSSTIGHGGQSIFKISFNPSAVGLRTAIATIYSNDSQNLAFSFSVAGTGA